MADYYLDLFSPASWREFLDHGATVTGFHGNKKRAVHQIRPGDYLICYMTRVSRWVGLLQAESAPYYDETPLWREAPFPWRLRVQPVLTLSQGYGVPIFDLRNELSIFQNLANPNAWTGRLRKSPIAWPAGDAQAVIQALQEAAQIPIERPDGAAEPSTPAAEDAVPAAPASLADPGAELDEAAGDHTEMQWLLVKLGSELGLSVWVPRNDRTKTYRGQQLDTVRGVRNRLPDQFDSRTADKIQYIDVLWIRNDAVIAAFEIENSTAIHSGLLRMNDLVARQPHLNIPLFIVAPQRRQAKVLAEIKRPSFEAQPTPLRHICHYLAFERLKEKRRQLLAVLESLRPLQPEFLHQLAVSAEPDEVEESDVAGR